MAWLINNNELVKGKFLSLSSLLAVENFGGCEILKVLIISENLDFVFRSLKIIVLFFKGLNYSPKSFIVDFIIYFRRCKLLKIKNNRMEFFIKAFLGKDYLQGVIKGVNFNYDFLKRVK